jgi:hypothetical protein
MYRIVVNINKILTFKYDNNCIYLMLTALNTIVMSIFIKLSCSINIMGIICYFYRNKKI